MSPLLFMILVFSPVVTMSLFVEFESYGGWLFAVIRSLCGMAGVWAIVLDVFSLFVAIFGGGSAVASLWLAFIGGPLTWVLVVCLIGAFLEPWFERDWNWGGTISRSFVLAVVCALIYGFYLLMAMAFPFLG